VYLNIHKVKIVMECKTKKLSSVSYLFFFAFIFLISIASASLDSAGTYKVNQEFNFTQPCVDASYITLSLIKAPSGTTIIDENMTLISTGVYAYNFTPSETGRHFFEGTSDGCERTFATYIDVTPSGSLLDQASSVTLFGSLIVMIIIGLAFLFMGSKSESIAGKISFITLGVVVFIMVVLYTVVTIQQVLYGFDGILTGIETFLFVMKTLLTIGILGFFVVIAMVLFKAWKIKRGLYDE
jgi:hypothetical protein